MESNLLSRKFIFAMTALLLGFILVLSHNLDAEKYLTFVEIIGGTYVIGNVGATVANKFNISER